MSQESRKEKASACSFPFLKKHESCFSTLEKRKNLLPPLEKGGRGGFAFGAASKNSRSFLTHRPALLVFSILMTLAVCVSPASAKTISSSELIEKNRFYDGKTISFQGEVVGDVMVRGENAWIHLNDDRYGSENVEEGSKLEGYNSGHAVWCRASDVESIEYVGDYKNSGDVVEVNGVFNRACAEHGGDMDIHADGVELVRRGHAVSHPFNAQRALIALILGAAGLSLFLANRAQVQKRLQEQSG